MYLSQLGARIALQKKQKCLLYRAKCSSLASLVSSVMIKLVFDYAQNKLVCTMCLIIICRHKDIAFLVNLIGIADSQHGSFIYPTQHTWYSCPSTTSQCTQSILKLRVNNSTQLFYFLFGMHRPNWQAVSMAIYSHSIHFYLYLLSYLYSLCSTTQVKCNILM